MPADDRLTALIDAWTAWDLRPGAPDTAERLEVELARVTITPGLFRRTVEELRRTGVPIVEAITRTATATRHLRVVPTVGAA